MMSRPEKYMSKRILMVAPEPIFEPRGTPFSVVGRLKALSDMGHKVDLITYPMGEDVRFPGVRIIRIPRVPGIRKIKIGPSLAKIPLDLLLIVYTAFYLCGNRYDLLHTHEEAGFWGTLFSRIRGIPHLYDMHSSLPQQLSNFQFSKSRVLVSMFRKLEGWVLSNADSIITICPDLRDHVLDEQPEKGSFLIENVVDYEQIFGETDRSADIRKEYSLDSRTVALYAGTLEPYQGIDLLIQSAAIAVQQHKDLLFLVVGGHADQVSMYRSMAREKGLESSMIFTGQVPPSHVKSYMRCADLLLSPRTRGTNTPLKIYSYLKAGIPVVATRLLTHTQVLNDDVAVLTEPGPESFASGIIHILDDKQQYRSIVTRAQQLAEEQYSYTVYVRKFTAAVERGFSGGR